jgi:hypothetical protein
MDEDACKHKEEEAFTTTDDHASKEAASHRANSGEV